jgi:hypothetical protein
MTGRPIGQLEDLARPATGPLAVGMTGSTGASRDLGLGALGLLGLAAVALTLGRRARRAAV